MPLFYLLSAVSHILISISPIIKITVMYLSNFLEFSARNLEKKHSVIRIMVVPGYRLFGDGTRLNFEGR